MMESKFKTFYKKKHTYNAVNTRISLARKAEGILGKSLDTVVSDDNEMFNAMIELKKHDNPKNAPLQNAVRCYYLFIRSKGFPRVNDYVKKHP